MSSSRRSFHGLFRPLSPEGSRSQRRRTHSNDNPSLQAIWEAISRVPRGSWSTYGDVARAAGLPGRARLTAFALRHAPDDMRLPWHRILGAGGKIVFPLGSRPHKEQTRLLRSEGVDVKHGRADASAMAELS